MKTLEYYNEVLPSSGGLSISFNTVREVGGDNVVRLHDKELAQLFAASPDLLAASKAALTCLITGNGRGDAAFALGRAIRKAEGET